MFFCKFKDVVYYIFCNLVNGKGFSWSGLAIGKDCDYSVVEQAREEVFDGILIEILAIFVFVEGIVKFEVSVLDVFCYAVYFVFWLVDYNFRITCTDRINFSTLIFLIKEWSLTNTNTYTHFRRRHVIKSRTNLTFMFLNQNIKIDIGFISAHFFILFSSSYFH